MLCKLGMIKQLCYNLLFIILRVATCYVDLIPFDFDIVEGIKRKLLSSCLCIQNAAWRARIDIALMYVERDKRPAALQ